MKNPLRLTSFASSPERGSLCIFREAVQNLPLSGEVALRSNDGEGSFSYFLL